MKQIVTLLFFFYYGVVYSQPNYPHKNIDSLKNAATSQKALEKIKTLSDIDYEYIQSGNFALFLENHAKLKKELIKYSENCDYYWIWFFSQSVTYYSTIDDYKNIFFLLQKIIDFKTEDKNALNLKAVAYRNMIAILKGFEQYDEALQYAEKAENFIANNSINKIFTTGIYVEISDINFILYNNSKLTKSGNKSIYLKRAIDYLKKANSNITILPKDKFENKIYYNTLYLLASNIYKIGKKEDAEKIFQKFDSLKTKNIISYRTYLFARGYEFDTKSKDSIILNPDVLLKNIDKVIALNEKTNFKIQNIYFINHKARVLKKIKKYVLAEKEFKKVYKWIEKLGDDKLLRLEAAEALGEIYEKLGQKDKALFYKNQTIKLSQYVTKANSPFSTQKAQIILLLEKQRQQRQLELEKLETQKNHNYFIITLMSLAIIFAIAFVLFLFNRNLKIKQKFLKSEINYNKEVTLNQELENIYQIKMELSNQKATIENRQKIAKNLHDDLASSLAITNFMIMDKVERSETDKDKISLLEIYEEVNSLYKNVRRYIHKLRKDDEQNSFSVTEYLFELIKKNEVLNDLKFIIDADFKKLDEKLNVFQKNQLYRIIKESVTNSLKYAQASKIEIIIKINEQGCLFSIKDNGKGSFISQKWGLGIANMKERIAQLGGVLTIQSNKETGTIISGQFSL